MSFFKDCVSELTSQIEKNVLCKGCGEPQVEATQQILLNCLSKLSDAEFCEKYQAKNSCYSRHLLYRHPKDLCSVVMMIWGPGQSTAIHDHGGVWCVEGVLKGELEIVDYRIKQESNNCISATPVKTIRAGVGAVGNLIPPFEHHLIRNPGTSTAVSLHVYGAEIKECRRFLPLENGLYKPDTVSLCYDSELA